MTVLLLWAAALGPLADFTRERAAASGPAPLLAAADALAADARAALQAGDHPSAVRLAREARWLLPAAPAGLPPHVRRVFGAGRLRHADRVNAVAYFPDGASVASASRDGTVRVWDLRNGRERTVYRGHAAAAGVFRATAVAVHPGGTLVASAGGPEVHLWDPATGREVKVLAGGQEEPVRAVAFAPDGATLVAADDRGGVVGWDVAGGAPRWTLPAQRLRLEGLAVGADRFATVGQAGELTLFDLRQPLKGPLHVTSPGDADRQPLFAVAFAGGAVVAAGANREVRVYAAGGAAPGSLLRTLAGHPDAVLAAAADAAGTVLATAGRDGVRVWDTATGRPLRVFPGPPGGATAVAVRADGREAVAGGEDGSLRVWPLAPTDAHRRLDLPTPGFATAVSPDGKRLAVAGADGVVRLFDPAGGTLLKALSGHAAGVAAVCFVGPTTLASGGGDRVVRVWDADAGTARELRGHTSAVLALAVAGDRLVSGGADGTVRGWDVATGKQLWAFAGRSAVCGLAPVGADQLAVGTADGSLLLLDVQADPRRLGDAVAHNRAVLGVAARADGSLVATAGGDGVVRLWRPSAGGPLPAGRVDPPTPTAPPAAGVAFSPDGLLLAIGYADGLVRVWDPAGGVERRTLRGHADWAAGVAFSPDGRTLAVAGADKTVRLFPAPRGDGRPPAHAGRVLGVALSPDGTTLATGADDKTVKLWDVATGAERRTVVGAGDAVEAVAFAGNELVVASADGLLRCHAPDGTELHRLLTHRTFALAAAADGTVLTAWQHRQDPGFGFDRFARRAAGPTRGEEVPGPVTCAAVSATARLGAVGGPDGLVRLWDLRTGRRTGDDWQRSDRPLLDVQFSPDGQTLLALDEAGTVSVATVAGRTVRATASVPGAGGLTAAADRFATFGADGLVRAFTLAGQEVRRWPLPGPVTSAAFAADGRTLAVGNADGTAYLLELP